MTAGSVLANAQTAACAVTEPWLTTYRSSVTYTIPKIDVLLAGSIRSTPNVQPSTINTFVATNGASLPANYNVNSAILQTSNLGASAHAWSGVPDGRSDAAGRRLSRSRSTRSICGSPRSCASDATSTNVGFDFYNLLNANTGTAFQQVYDVNPANVVWARPTIDPESALRAVQRHAELLNGWWLVAGGSRKPPTPNHQIPRYRDHERPAPTSLNRRPRTSNQSAIQDSESWRTWIWMSGACRSGLSC